MNTGECAPMNHTLSAVRTWLLADLRRPAVLISIVFSIWAILTNDVINTDGVLYLDVAYHISNLDWAAAAVIYHWNFYPALIALTSKITFLDLESAAFLINNLFLAGLAWMFLSVLMIMGADRRVLIGGLVLISIHPYINDYRADIIRGPGFWFFIVYGTYYLIRLQQGSHFRYGVFISLAFIMAALFRIEGIAFVIFAPLILLVGTDSLNNKIKLILGTYLIPAAATLLALIILMFSGDGASMGWTNNPVGKIQHPMRLMVDAYQSLTHEIPAKGQIIANQVLNQHSEDYGTLGVIAILSTMLILTTLKRITLLVFLLAIYGKLKREIRHLPVLAWLSLINIGYMAVYVIHEFFLSSRFAMPIALFFALAGSYGLARLFTHPDPAGTGIKFLRAIVIFFMLIMLVDGLVSFGTSKTYIRDGGHWIGENLNPGEKIISNQILVNHYAGIRMTFDERQKIILFESQLNTGNPSAELLKDVKYVAIRAKHIHPKTHQKVESILQDFTVKEFSSSDKERLIIYTRQ